MLHVPVNCVCSIDATSPSSGLGRYANDCWQNPPAKMVQMNAGPRPRLILRALRDIQAGEEIMYDYGVDAPWRHSHVSWNACNLVCCFSC